MLTFVATGRAEEFPSGKIAMSYITYHDFSTRSSGSIVVNAKAKNDHSTPLIIAAALGVEKDRKAAVVKALLDRNADPNSKDQDGNTVSAFMNALDPC